MAQRTDRRDLVGTREAAELFRVRPSNFVRDWASRPDFPAPIADLAATRVWSRDELQAYRDRERRTAPPRSRSLRLSDAAARWLPTIKRRIVRRFHPERIVVFGSQARGDSRPGSDVDLLIVLTEVRDRRAVRLAILEALDGIPFGTDVVVATPTDLQRFGQLAGTVLQPALREGVTIYARS